MNILRTQHESVVTLTINRPTRLNALDYKTITHLQKHLTACEREDEVRAVILTGAGERAFSAGADLVDVARSVSGGAERAVREVVGKGQGLTRRIENFPKPIIAAVNGLAFGGGCEVVEAAHIAIASERATFGKPEVSLGFPPPFGGSQRLPRHVGRKRGLEMILTGDPVDAERAAEIGLVNFVVPGGTLMDECHRLAERITRHSSTAVTACLAAVTRGLNVSIEEGLAVEAAWFASTVGSQGVADGLSPYFAPNYKQVSSR